MAKTGCSGLQNKQRWPQDKQRWLQNLRLWWQAMHTSATPLSLW